MTLALINEFIALPELESEHGSVMDTVLELVHGGMRFAPILILAAALLALVGLSFGAVKLIQFCTKNSGSVSTASR